MKSTKKQILAFLIILFLSLSAIGVSIYEPQENAFASSGEVRAVWLAYVNYEKLGLKTDNEGKFRKSVSAFLNDAKSNYINTVYFHVRAFDDAAWKSKTFRPSKNLTSKSSFAFDPLSIVIELTHKKGMTIHAWMNPYRINFDYFLDPALGTTTERINKAVEEVMAYDVDGIHFDDYFYNAKKGYKNVNGTITVTNGKLPTNAKKRANVNKMVKEVYSKVKSINENAKFGISPQGNLQNCRNAGADIDAWLSEDGYLDYIVPQLYWTNHWGIQGNVSMFNDRLNAWVGINKKKKPMYIGLAAYRTGVKYEDDPGWMRSSNNLASQLNHLRGKGCKGYFLFAATDLSRKEAKTELSKLRRMVQRIPTVEVSYRDYQSLSIEWNKIAGVKGYRIYRAKSKKGTYKAIITLTSAKKIRCVDTGLTPGKKYYYKIRSYSISGEKKVFNPASYVSVKTAIPKRPKVSSQAKVKKIKISWKQVPNVTGYVVYRAGSKNGSYHAKKTLSSKTHYYVSKNLKSGKKYYYKVRAYKKVKSKRIYSNYSACIARKAK